MQVRTSVKYTAKHKVKRAIVRSNTAKYSQCVTKIQRDEEECVYACVSEMGERTHPGTTGHSLQFLFALRFEVGCCVGIALCRLLEETLLRLL